MQRIVLMKIEMLTYVTGQVTVVSSLCDLIDYVCSLVVLFLFMIGEVD